MHEYTNMPYIYGIGFPRTGTLSVATGLKEMGFDSVHATNFGDLLKHEAVIGEPAAFWWKELAAAFPKARFVLTIRNIDAWRDSCARMFREHFWMNRIANEADMTLQLIYKRWFGSAEYDPSWIPVYVQHNADVQTFFSSAPERLCVIDLADGNAFEMLGAFLGKEHPKKGFPHLNKNKFESMP